jgi:pimeloyl-ACP methyl ester carboxylesterase
MSPFEKSWVIRFARGLLPLKTRREGTLNDYVQLTEMAPLPFERIKSPCMVIHAADDPLVPIAHGRLSASGIPEARLVELPQGGHLLVGHQQMVARFIKKFLGEHAD